MEMLYNPDAMPERELRETLVGRQGLIDELVAIIERQPRGAGVQHLIVKGPRGMGKTTVLLALRLNLLDRGLGEQWQAVKFPEESYGITDLADFWLHVLALLAADAGDHALAERADRLKDEFAKYDELHDAALALLRDWSRARGKRLLLLVDNFDMILEQIRDEQDNARLRQVLMNDGTMMLVGGAVSFFEEARAYDQPLYNFFRILDIEGLAPPQVMELVRRRAAVDGVQDFEKILAASRGRFRALEYFTGGNPRLVLMLYRVVTQSDFSEARRGLEKLLDEVTPYYKAKTESLPPQQRKILDHIARVGSRTREGTTPKEIAAALRLAPNQVSAQLNRLAEFGYVRSANLRGRQSYYMLSEPLYAIWHQMRFGRDARQRMAWLVNFLGVWYEAGEAGAEIGRLDARFREHWAAGHTERAQDFLEHGRLLLECLSDMGTRSQAADLMLRDHLQIGDLDHAREMLRSVSAEDLPPETLAELEKAGLAPGKAATVGSGADAAPGGDPAEAEAMAECAAGLEALKSGRVEEALNRFSRMVEIKPEMEVGWLARGVALARLGRPEEALASYNRALEIKPDMPEAGWLARGGALAGLGRLEEALASYDRALEIKPDRPEAWCARGGALAGLGRFKEALASYDRALEIKPDMPEAWHCRGHALRQLARMEQAIASCDHALEIKPDMHEAWSNRALALASLGRLDEALLSCDKALEIQPSCNTLGWAARAGIYFLKLVESVVEKDVHGARAAWREAQKSVSHLAKGEWEEIAVEAFVVMAPSGSLDEVRRMIRDAGMEEPLFPLARAIDYVLSGDGALIEKLSPEVRGIVEQVAEKLRKSAGQEKVPAPPHKRKRPSAPRSRTRKQL